MKEHEIVEYSLPAFQHMAEFYTDTLVRLLISFVPMIDFMMKNKLTPRSIGSFGSGSCSHESFLSDIFPTAEVNCFDQTERYIPKYTKEKFDNSRNLTFNSVAFEDFKWESYADRYDYVFSIQTLEHIQDAELGLKNLAATVKPGGYLYVDTPFYSEDTTLDSAEYLEMERKRQWEKNEHFHLGFSPILIGKRLEALGYEILSSGYYSYEHFDGTFLHLMRSSEAFKSEKADATVIAGFIRIFHALLTRAESLAPTEFEKFERLPHADRSQSAMRVLARRVR